MKKRLLMLMLAGVLVSFTFVGCSDDDASEEDTKVEESADAEEEETEAEEESGEEGTEEEGTEEETEESGEVDTSAIIGSWMTGCYMKDGESYNPDEYAELNNIEDATSLVFVYTFNEDGTVVAQAAATGEVANGTWEVSGENIIASFENGSQVPFEYSAENDMMGVEDTTTGVITLFGRYNPQ